MKRLRTLFSTILFRVKLARFYFKTLHPVRASHAYDENGNYTGSTLVIIKKWFPFGVGKQIIRIPYDYRKCEFEGGFRCTKYEYYAPLDATDDLNV